MNFDKKESNIFRIRPFYIPAMLCQLLNATHFRSEAIQCPDQKKQKYRTRVYITNEKHETRTSRNDVSNERHYLLKDASNNTPRTWNEKYTRSDPVITKSRFSSNKENVSGGKISPIYENVPRHFSRSSSGSSRDSLSSGQSPAKPLVGILKVPGRRKHYFTKHVEFLEDHQTILMSRDL